MAERHRIGRNLLDLANGLVKRRGGPGGSRRRCCPADRPRRDARQASLRVDQELARCDNLLLQSGMRRFRNLTVQTRILLPQLGLSQHNPF